MDGLDPMVGGEILLLLKWLLSLLGPVPRRDRPEPSMNGKYLLTSGFRVMMDPTTMPALISTTVQYVRAAAV